MTSTRRSGTAVTAVVAAAFLAAIAAPAVAADATAVHLRFSENEKSGTAPIAGTYTVSGAISDHGTASGTHYPIYKKVKGKVQAVGIELVQTQHGRHGSFKMICRDTHFTFGSDGNVTRATGRCAFSNATGIYRSLAPVASSVLVPTHPRKGYTHTVRRLTGHTS